MGQSETYASTDASHMKMCNWATKRDSCIYCMGKKDVCNVSVQPSFVPSGSCPAALSCLYFHQVSMRSILVYQTGTPGP